MTSDENLIKAYEKTKKELEKKLKSAKAGTAKSYYRKLLKEIEESIKELQKSAAAYVNTAVPADYMENAAEIFEQMKAQNIIMKPPEAFRQLHTDAIYDLRREVMTQIEQGIAKAKEQTQKLVAEAHEIAQKAALRSMGLDAAQHKIDTVGTVTDMQQEMIKKLEETGILKVELGSGEHKREMSITNYAHLVARSTSREVGNTARINQMSANGFDLVEIPPHYPTCEICAILQDRVYSISGEDKRFPPLSKAIGVYKNIHPHCRHVIVGWAEMMYTPEEIEEAIKKSNRPWTDPRSGEEKQFYNELQRKNRQARDLQYQYDRYKQRLGGDAPKSLYAFKRIKKAGGEKWEELQEKYRKAGVDNSRRSDTLNEVINSKYYSGELKEHEITDDTIKKLKPLDIKGYSKEKNEILCEAEKDLLKYVKDQPLGTEGVICLDMKLNEMDRYLSNTSNGMIGLKRYDKDCIILHNHPNGLIFSEQDYITFSQNDEIKGLAAVGNNGTVFLIFKTKKFNNFEFDCETHKIRQNFPQSMSVEDHLKYSETIFEEIKRYGIKTYFGRIN